jgi:hypothetical protein
VRVIVSATGVELRVALHDVRALQR